MMKKIIALLLIVTMIACLFAGCKFGPKDDVPVDPSSPQQSEDISNEDDKNATDENKKDEEQEFVEPETTEPVDPMMEEICGIPKMSFESTKDRTWEFYLYNNETQQKFPINGEEPLNSIEYEWVDLKAQHEAIGIFDEDLTPANETLVIVRLDPEKDENRFIFGVVNKTDKDVDGNELPVIFVEYCGDEEWNLSGIQVGMTRQEIIDLLGEPTQEMPNDWGYAIEYYVLQNDHVYILSGRLDSKDGYVTDVSLIIDNYPLYG